MKLFCTKLALCFLGLLIVLCYSCGIKEPARNEAIDAASKPTHQEQIETKQLEVKALVAKELETKPAPEEQEKKKPKEQPVIEAPSTSSCRRQEWGSNAVAKISDYVITKEELEKRFMTELRPRYENYGKETEPVDVKTTLIRMIAEKAMVMEARKQDYLERETIQTLLKQFKEGRLISSLLQRYLQDKIKVTDLEIDEQIKANPKLDRIRARAMLERAQGNKLVGEYYSELYKKFHVEKLKGNFPKAAEIHQRLLLYPKEPRKLKFIHETQVRNELTPEEKNIGLARYDNEKVTLKDWFDTLCDIAPPSRPRDLNTSEGVERLLDRALDKPVFVAEAKLLGLDKDENFLRQVKEEEDKRLFYEIRNEKAKDVNVPTGEEQIIAYFNKNKGAFGTRNTLKIDQIWCQDRNTAQNVKAELDSGKDFESVRQQYSLEKKGSPFVTYPSRQGMFFKDLWKGEPNEIVGPVKGFYHGGFKWRIVKIFEKKPGEVKEYSSDMQNQIKWRMESEQRNAALAGYQKELLGKYSYQIYADRIKDIDPLNIP